MTSDGSVTITTGIAGVDEILRGGLPAGNMYLCHGPPGTGKTTLALRFLLAGIEANERVLYFALGETPSELAAVARSHGWSLDGIEICDLHETEQNDGDAEYTFFHSAEVELTETTKTMLAWIDRVSPSRVVLDSLSEMRMLARDSLRYRRQILALKHQLGSRGCTVIMLDTASNSTVDFHIETVAHGVLKLEQHEPAYGPKRRRLAFDKVRGVAFRDGWHDYIIETGGVRVFPRLAPQTTGNESATSELVTSGNGDLDALLGGGAERGSSTLIVGPSGVGKSTLSMQFVRGLVERKEASVVYLFDESRAAWMHRARQLGMGLADEGVPVEVRAVNPSELSPGELTMDVCRQIEERGVKLIVIDSLNGFREAMTEDGYAERLVHELISFAAQHGVNTLLTLATFGTSGPSASAPMDVSYLADTIIALRYFEAFGDVRKAISVLKKRMGAHETTIRELDIRSGSGIRIGDKLQEFRGVLTSAPEYTGKKGDLLKSEDGRQR